MNIKIYRNITLFYVKKNNELYRSKLADVFYYRLLFTKNIFYDTTFNDYVACGPAGNCGLYKNQPDVLMPQQSKTNMAAAAPETFSGGAQKLENPYSVSNMRKAYQSLAAASRSMNASGADAIKATHRYVKFMPANEEALDLLKQDTTLDLYPYPLDVAFPEGTDLSNYRDPETPEGQPGYLYASVPVQHKMPQVKHAVLEELFIPDEEKTGDAPEIATRAAATPGNAVSGVLQGLDPEALVERSLQLTKNEEYAHDNSTVRSTTGIVAYARRGRWRPAGRIQVWDNHINQQIPLEGVYVRARRWFTTHRGRTNNMGYYSCDGTFKRRANYLLLFETNNFSLRRHYIAGVAEIDGPKITGDWNRNIQGGHDEQLGTVFRAAYHYYYKDIQGLRRPPENSFWKTQVKLAVLNRTKGGTAGDYSPAGRFLGITSPIRIFRVDGAKAYNYYGTTIHELAHASHWNMSRGGDYKNADLIVAESWARGVQWVLTKMIYPFYRGGSNRQPYTNFIMDLIDSTSDDGTNNGANSPQDQVSGYTIKQIEDALIGQRTLEQLKNNLKNKYENPTKNQVDALYNYWVNHP